MADLLRSLVKWCRETEGLLAEAPDEIFAQSRLHELALSKAVEQVGELCGRLLLKYPSFAEQNEALELQAAYGMRNRLGHGYDDIIVQIVVNTGRHDIPALRAAVERILTDAGEPLS
ncbi:MAG: hypothetical protein CMP81_01905 [Fulvimarina sp.]|nr:hypothetical protein [Fulvimarina sp.]